MKREESKIQSAIVKLLRYEGYLVAAIPNGGERSKATGAILKREGVLAGHSDLNIYTGETVIFVEVKTPKGTQSENQIKFEETVKKMGYQYLIWRSIDDCIDWINLQNGLENYVREN